MKRKDSKHEGIHEDRRDSWKGCVSGWPWSKGVLKPFIKDGVTLASDWCLIVHYFTHDEHKIIIVIAGKLNKNYKRI